MRKIYEQPSNLNKYELYFYINIENKKNVSCINYFVNMSLSSNFLIVFYFVSIVIRGNFA